MGCYKPYTTNVKNDIYFGWVWVCCAQFITTANKTFSFSTEIS